MNGRAPKVDGRELASPPGPEGRHVFADHISPEPMVSSYGKRAARHQHAVFADMMKYIVMSDGCKELYDPWADPNEEKNLYRPGDEAIGRLDAMMQSRIKLFKTPGKPSLGLSPADLERLRSLGYVQ